MNRIQEIKTQIQFIEAELVKLRHEKEELEQSLPVLVGGEPSELATAAKAAAIALAEKKPQLNGVSNAIALLERRLLPLQREFDQLAAQAKTEQEQSERAELLKVGQAQIQDQVERIHDLAELLDRSYAVG